MTNSEGFWEIRIRKANNGFICYWEDEEEETEGKPYFKKQEMVFEEKDEHWGADNLNQDELENMKNMLFYIKEFFGIVYSKHNKQNLVIDIEENKENE